MVLLACQGAVYDLVLLDLCFTVVPLEVKAGCCAGANPQVLGGVNLYKESGITKITWADVCSSHIWNPNMLCGDSPHLLTLCLTCGWPLSQVSQDRCVGSEERFTQELDTRPFPLPPCPFRISSGVLEI